MLNDVVESQYLKLELEPMEFCFRQDKFESLGKVVHELHHIHVSLDPLDVGCKHLRLSGRRKNYKAG